jgi:uncharacterized protein (DUF1810 family)
VTDAADPFHLERFVEAQANGVFEQALAELRAGQKRSHWMWFIFPQHRDLGRSATAKYFGLSGIEEARAYAAHPLLGPRLRESAGALLAHLEEKSAEEILGPVDTMKLRSSMEIFAEAVPDEPLFGEVRRMAG